MKRTSLVFEGMAPDEVTETFLVELMDVCEEHRLGVEGIGIERRR